MNCPVCGAPLIIVERNNIELDYCPKCQGFWLDNGELELLNEILEIDADYMNPLGRPFIESSEKHYNCPKCGSQMGKIEVNGVLLDVCPNADGIWFDKGELSSVLNSGKENSKVINFLGEVFIQ